jgi:hypothetical protein
MENHNRFQCENIALVGGHKCRRAVAKWGFGGRHVLFGWYVVNSGKHVLCL